MKIEKQNHMKSTCSPKPNKITKTYQTLAVKTWANKGYEQRESQTERRGMLWAWREEESSKSACWVCVCVYRVFLKICIGLKKKSIGFCFGEENNVFNSIFFMFGILCCADVENCGASRGFSYIYIYDMDKQWCYYALF